MLVVYTAITGGFKDRLRTPEVTTDHKGREIQFVCFSDSVNFPTSPWRLAPPQWEHPVDSRRTARWHKTHPHILFPDAEWTLWHDGSHQLTVNPWEIVDYVIGWKARFGSFSHPDRQSIKQELAACIKLGKDSASIMRHQVERYAAEGFTDALDSRLFETSCVVRQNSPECTELNEAWWKEIRDGSVRDQLSLTYCLWRHKPCTVFIPGNRIKSPYFRFHAHR